MSNALAMTFDAAIGGDITLGKTFVAGDWLETVVVTSLFTDARANDDEIPAGETERGGYWGDVFDERSLGSLLWTLRRAKMTQESILRARDICIDALAWLVSAKHVKAVDVQTEKLARDRLGITVYVTRNNGTLQTLQYQLDLTGA